MEETMKPIAPSEQTAAAESEEISLSTLRSNLKAEKRELNGKISDLRYDGLSPEQYEKAKKALENGYAGEIADYHAAVKDVTTKIGKLKAEKQAIRERSKLRIDEIRAKEKNPDSVQIEKAKVQYRSDFQVENQSYSSQTAALRGQISAIKNRANDEDRELRAQYRTVKRSSIKRAEKAEKLDALKAKIYSNSGTADLETLDLANKLKALKIDHKAKIATLVNSLHLVTNHVQTMIKNEKHTVRDRLKNYGNIDHFEKDYESIAPFYYKFGMGVRHWGLNFAHNYKVSFTSWGGFTNWLVKNIIYIVIIAMVIAADIYNGGDWINWGTIINIVKHTSSILPLALGVAGTIVLTGTDLSLGRTLGLTACFSAILLGYMGGNGAYAVLPWTQSMPWIWIIVVLLIVMAIGGLCGALNGFFVAKYQIHPFIVTLATQLIIYGVLMLAAASLNFSVTSASTSNISIWYYNFVSSGFYIGSTLVEWYNVFAVVMLIVIWFVWNKTKFGKGMFAVGCNPDAAAVSGISVFKINLITFILAGVMYGVAGFEYNPINGGAQLSTGAGAELDPITAAVIGGVSFTGGVGKVSGVLLGCFLLKVISSCLNAMAISTSWQYIVKGIVILFATALDMKKYIVKK